MPFNDVNPQATFVPNKMKVTFDGKLLKEINKWLETDANKFIYIHGGIDTCSGSAVPRKEKVDSERFFLTGKYHGTARIASRYDRGGKKAIYSCPRAMAVH